jgi:hypothetical protein
MYILEYNDKKRYLGHIRVTPRVNGILDVGCELSSSGYDSKNNLRRMMVAVVKTDPNIVDGMTDVKIVGTLQQANVKVKHICPQLDGEETILEKLIPRARVQARVRRLMEQTKQIYEVVTNVVCDGEVKRVKIIV